MGNGGFDLWFRSSGHRAAPTVRGLRLLNMDSVAQVVRLQVGDDEEARSEAIDSMSEADYERLDALSQRVWGASDDLEKAMVEAVRAHPSLFPRSDRP
ncbi:MAG: DMP19 family protein [Actinomycetota bacterium]|nr:DMP19 family protein [Actinomycetota bacterium]